MMLSDAQKSIEVINIEKERENVVKKYGSKRTKNVYTRIWNRIQVLWTEFVANDVLLTEAAASNNDILQQPYFKEKRKDLAEKIYSKATEFLISHYPDIEANASGTQQDSFSIEDDESSGEEEKTVTPLPTKQSTSTENKQDYIDGDDKSVNSKSFENKQESSAADYALMKISEVLATQHQFQLQMQQQMSTLMANTDRHQGLKPPRVEIPTFSCQLNLYKSFKDTFLTVTNNSCMSNLEKLTLLKSKVCDIALEFTSHITIAEENYEKAWKILDDRFDDPVAIISTSVDKILDMPKIPPNNVRAVEKALNLVQGVANSLELLKIDPNQVVLVRAIIRKLSDQASGELTRLIGNHKEFPTYEKLIDFFINHLSILRARSTFDEEPEEVVPPEKIA